MLCAPCSQARAHTAAPRGSAALHRLAAVDVVDRQLVDALALVDAEQASHSMWSRASPRATSCPASLQTPNPSTPPHPIPPTLRSRAGPFGLQRESAEEWCRGEEWRRYEVPLAHAHCHCMDAPAHSLTGPPSCCAVRAASVRAAVTSRPACDGCATSRCRCRPPPRARHASCRAVGGVRQGCRSARTYKLDGARREASHCSCDSAPHPAHSTSSAQWAALPAAQPHSPTVPRTTHPVAGSRHAPGDPDRARARIQFDCVVA